MCWLEDAERVVAEVESNDEPSFDIFRNSCVKSCRETQNLLIIVNILEEVALGLVRHELVNIAERVNFVSKAVVWWHLKGLGFAWLREFNLSNVKVLAVVLLIEFLCELINTRHTEDTSEGIYLLAWFDLIAGQVIIADEVLPGLVHRKAFRELLAFEQQSK